MQSVDATPYLYCILTMIPDLPSYVGLVSCVIASAFFFIRSLYFTLLYFYFTSTGNLPVRNSIDTWFCFGCVIIYWPGSRIARYVWDESVFWVSSIHLQ